MPRDPYFILGVERDVTQDEIAAACCAPFTVFMGASTGAMPGRAAGWLRKAANADRLLHRRKSVQSSAHGLLGAGPDGRAREIDYAKALGHGHELLG